MFRSCLWCLCTCLRACAQIVNNVYTISTRDEDGQTEKREIRELTSTVELLDVLRTVFLIEAPEGSKDIDRCVHMCVCACMCACVCVLRARCQRQRASL
jgi:hypothetical protein